MIQIAPSVLAADFANLERDCARALLPDNRIIHFDVMDGVFVPNLSVGIPVLKSLAQALPDVFYDAHLMIVRPDAYAGAFVKAGAGGVTIHLESDAPLRKTLCDIRALGARAGLSLRPQTPIEALYEYLPDVDLVLVMSVEPGFGGQAFMPEAPRRIARLRAEARRRDIPLLIEVDGGINEATAAECIAAGADILVAGSTVFGADDPAAMMRRLRAEKARE